MLDAPRQERPEVGADGDARATATLTPAITATNKTYDVAFLLQAGARGIRADQATAAFWFRKAAALGDAEGRERLVRIEGQPRK